MDGTTFWTLKVTSQLASPGAESAVSMTAMLYQPEAGRLRAVVIVVYAVVSLDKNLLNPWIPFPGSSWLVDFNLICLQCFDTVGWAS